MSVSTAGAEQTRSEFESLIQAHRKQLHKVVNTYCFHPEDRRDLMQEIVAEVWRAYPRYDPQRPFSTWIYRIALNVAISYVRTSVRRNRHLAPFNEALTDVADSRAVDHEVDDQVRVLYRFIATLDFLNRALLLLYLEECSAREIAEVLGISESNVTTRIGRLKRRIRDHMEPEK